MLSQALRYISFLEQLLLHDVHQQDQQQQLEVQEEVQQQNIMPETLMSPEEPMKEQDWNQVLQLLLMATSCT